LFDLIFVSTERLHFVTRDAKSFHERAIALANFSQHVRDVITKVATFDFACCKILQLRETSELNFFAQNQKNTVVLEITTFLVLTKFLKFLKWHFKIFQLFETVLRKVLKSFDTRVATFKKNF